MEVEGRVKLRSRGLTVARVDGQVSFYCCSSLLSDICSSTFADVTWTFVLGPRDQ